MVQNITLSAEKSLIEKARQRAEANNTTLNSEFRRWLAQYVDRPQNTADLAAIMARLSYVKVEGKFTRDELNER
jgi:hypothetical protein